MANLEEILKNIDNIKPEDLYSVLQKLGYDGDANELKQEIEKLFDEEELEFVSGGQNELSRRVGAGILGLLPIMTSITSDAFANDLNNSVTHPVSKNINKNNSKKINWQDIKNKGKQFAKEMNLTDKKTLAAFGVTSLVAFVIGYGLNSRTTSSKTVELFPEKMNKVQELATSSAQKDFENDNFDAWESGLKDLLINWFFDEEDKKREIDLSVVVKQNISMQLIRSETWLDNIYVNFNSQEMPLRDYIEQAVKNKKYRYSPNLLVYFLGVYRDTYVNNYKSVSDNYNVQKALNFVKDKLVFWCGSYIYWNERDSVVGLNHAISDLLSEETKAEVVLTLPKDFFCTCVDRTLEKLLQNSQLTINDAMPCSYSDGLNQLRVSYGLRLTDDEMFRICKGAVNTLRDITKGRPMEDPTKDLDDPNLTPEQQEDNMLDRIKYLSIEGNKIAEENRRLSDELSCEKKQVQALNQQIREQEKRNSKAIEELEHKHSEEIDKMKLEYSEKVEHEKEKQ